MVEGENTDVARRHDEYIIWCHQINSDIFVDIRWLVCSDESDLRIF